MEKRLEPRWLKLLGGDAWLDAATKGDTQWLAALRCLDRSSNANSLVMLLRGKIEMPRGFEMSPTARELVADLLERYHLKKKGRRTTLFKDSSPDRYNVAARNVRDMPAGVYTVLDKEQIKLLPRKLRLRLEHLDAEDIDGELFVEVVRALQVVQKTMSLTDRIDAVARVSQLDSGTLERHISNKVGWGRGKKRPSGKKPVAAK